MNNSYVQELIEWRKKQGYKVTVATTTSIDNDALKNQSESAINIYINNQNKKKGIETVKTEEEWESVKHKYVGKKPGMTEETMKQNLIKFEEREEHLKRRMTSIQARLTGEQRARRAGVVRIIDRRITTMDEMLEREPINRALKNSEISAFKHFGFWKCMDTLRDKNELEKIFRNGEVPWLKD